MKKHKSISVLCCDIGTSSIKVSLISETGISLIYNRKPVNASLYSLSWLHELSNAINDMGLSSTDIDAISISGNGPTIAAINNSDIFNTHSAKILMWNEVPQNSFLYNGKSIFLPRLLQLKKDYPQIFNDSYLFLSGPEFLFYQLTGKALTTLPNIRYKKFYWTEKDCLEYGIPKEKLANFATQNKSLEYLSQKAFAFLFSKEKFSTGKKEIPVICTGPDFISALIGTNTLSPGCVCDRAGSSEGLNVCTLTPIKDRAVRTLPSCISPYYNASIIFPESGSKFSEWKKKSVYSNLSFDKCVSEILHEKDAEGYPLILNLAFDLKKGLATLSKLTTIDQYIVLTGGQSRNFAWNQMKSDILHIPLQTTTCPDAELIGDAAVALTALKHYSSLQEAVTNLVHTRETFYPNEENNALYTKDYERYIS